jgi:hypothetical protein
LGPGEVAVRHTDLAEWTFEFDKVILFERSADGSRNVFELRRAQE